MKLQRALRARDIKVIGEEEEEIHVSGHPCRDELRQMYEWLKPSVLIPVHGYPPHLGAHAKLGAQCGIPQVIEIRNGDIVTFDSGVARRSGSAPVGRRVRPPEPSRRRPERGRRDESRAQRPTGRRRNSSSSRSPRNARGVRRSSSWLGDRSTQGRQSFLSRFGGRRADEERGDAERRSPDREDEVTSGEPQKRGKKPHQRRRKKGRRSYTR